MTEDTHDETFAVDEAEPLGEGPTSLDEAPALDEASWFEDALPPDEHPIRRHRLPMAAWVLVVPLVGALIWLTLLMGLSTTSPFEATVGRSMEPGLSTGDLAVMRGVAPQDLRLGDIVAIEVSEGDQREFGFPPTVLHRVIDIRMTDGLLTVQTKGDNQASPDPFLTAATDANRRMVASVPLLGWALFYLQSTQGLIAVGGLLALFLLYEAVNWATYTAEDILEPDPDEAQPLMGGFRELALAIDEYGEHLRSHTLVVRELGGATGDLHDATSMQREVLTDLRLAVRALATQAGRAAAPVEARDIDAPREVEATRDIEAGRPVDLLTAAPAAETAPASAIPTLIQWREGAFMLHLPPSVDASRVLEVGAALEAVFGAGAVALDEDGGAVCFVIETDEPWSAIEGLHTVAARAHLALETADEGSDA